MKKYLMWLFIGSIVLAFGVILLIVLPKTARLQNQAGSIWQQDVSSLDEYHIDGELEPDRRLLRLHQQMKLINRSGEPLSGVKLRTLANAYASLYTSPFATEELLDSSYPEGFSTGSLSILQVSINGSPATHEYLDAEKTICFLPCSWQKDTEVTVEVEYEVHIPHTTCRFGGSNTFFSLGDALIYSAAEQKKKGSQSELYAWGELPIRECANYTVCLNLPKEYSCVGSGEVQCKETDDRIEYHFSASCIRSFGLCVFAEAQSCRKVVNGTTIVCHGNTPSIAEELLQYAESTLLCYEELFGNYPYPVLTVTEAPLSGDGVAYTSLILVPKEALAEQTKAEEVISQLIAKQWWAQVVCPYRFTDSWMTESLTLYSHLLYLQKTKGFSARKNFEETNVIPATRISVDGNVTPGAPLDRFTGLYEFHQQAGEKGCALFLALELFSEGKLTETLRNFYRQFAFSIPSRQDFSNFFSVQFGKDIVPILSDYLDTLY